MSKILELQKANESLNQLRQEAKAEFVNLPFREKVKAFQQNDLSFLGKESDGGFLYRTFPGGGWGHVLADNFYYSRHEIVETNDLIERLFESWYSDEDTAEECEEKALTALETDGSDGCKLLRAVIEAGVYSFEFDW